MKNLIILGSRGIPNNHGGFETFCEEISLFLNKDYNVIVYCQIIGKGKPLIKKWNNITLIHIFTKNMSAKETIIFDFKSIIHSLKFKGIFLVLGYNTAVLNLLHFIFNKKIIFNMDGMEWKRKKWSFIQKVWLYINQYFAILIAKKIIADHPVIYDYYLSKTAKSKISMIPYGAHEDNYKIIKLNKIIDHQPYVLVLARIEPENQILDIITAYLNSKKKFSIFIVGSFDKSIEYHKKILNISSASKKVHFLGSEYDKKKLFSLRKNAAFYIHGHTVGGTNPSLIEAMAAGCAIIAHDNVFNRWVLGDGGLYFKSTQDLSDIFDKYKSNEKIKHHLSERSFNRYKKMFTWKIIFKEYAKIFKSI